MKAALLPEIGKPLRIEERPVPAIEPQDVLVETRSCGVCRTDLHICDGLAYLPELPHTPGHEPAGVVAEVGADVTGMEVGQRVVPHLFFTCGKCWYCRHGRDAQCTDLKGLLGVTQSGGFAEYFAAPAANLFVLPDQVSCEIGGLVSCAVITAIHAYRRARLELNDTAVVLGAGGIGQLLIQLLKGAGLKVAALSRAPGKLRIAGELGADLVCRTDAPDRAEQVKGLAGGDGAQCVFDCVGTAASMRDSADYVMRGGQIVVIGEEPEFPGIDTIQIAQRELEIIGSRNGSRQDAVDGIAMLAAGLLRPRIARRFPLDDIHEALECLRSGQADGRIVVTVKPE